MREIASAMRIDAHSGRGLMMVVGALLAAVFALAMPAPASAGSATHGRTLDVQFPAIPDAVACTSRQIILDPGTYSWRTGHSFSWESVTTWDAFDTTGYLTKRREYSWVDCIRGDQFWGGYSHLSQLSWPASGSEPGGVVSFSPVYSIHSSRTGLVSMWFGSRLIK